MQLLTKPYKVLYSKLYGYVVMSMCITAMLMMGSYMGVYVIPGPVGAWEKYGIMIAWQMGAMVIRAILETRMRGMEQHLDKWKMRPLLWLGLMLPCIWYVSLVYFVNYGVFWAILVTLGHLCVQGALIRNRLHDLRKDLANQEQHHIGVYRMMWEDCQ